MYIKQAFDTFIRIYDEIGYITNKATFADRVCNKSGAVFLELLKREPQTLDAVIEAASQRFEGGTAEDIRKFATEFYGQLAEDKFIVMAESIEELEKKDAENRFSYKSLKPKTIVTDFTPAIARADENTQVFLDNHFSIKPHLTHL